MPSTHQDDPLLLIRCPSCAQRFKVSESLRERTVECGGCEHRFKIKNEVILRVKRFYPGEREEKVLSRFSHVQSDTQASAGVVDYQKPPAPEMFEPATPLRIIAGVAGGLGMVLMALILIFGANHGGILDGVASEKRMILAGFVSLLGIAMLVYANPKARKKALGFGLLIGVALTSVPLAYTTNSAIVNRDSKIGFSAFEKNTPQTSVQSSLDAKLRDEIGTQPLDESIKLLEDSGSSKIAIGLWLKDVRLQNRFLIRDYIQRVTGISNVPRFYPRDLGNYLLVVDETNHSLQEVAKFASVLGTVKNIYPSLSVIEVKVNNENFVSNSIEKLGDMSDPVFYELNLKELESIDLTQAEEAVRRLSLAEPKIFRADITSKLIEMLGSSWISFKGEICRALIVWSETPGPAGEVALAQTRILLEKKVEIPQDMIALLVKEQNIEVIPILNRLWLEKPTEWERLYGDMGPSIEASLIASFSATQGGLRQSAVRLLGRIGGKDSLPLLKSAMEVDNLEMKALIEQSLETIQQRIEK